MSPDNPFDAMANHYVGSAVHASGSDLRRTVEWVPRSSFCLDVGAGTFHTSARLRSDRDAEVVSYDLSRNMLVSGREQYSGGIAVQGNATRLPFRSGGFDACVSRYAAHHFPSPAVCLREIGRVLRPGGRFVLCDVVAPEDGDAAAWLQELEQYRDPSHVRYYCRSEWIHMLDRAGYTIDAEEQFEITITVRDWFDRIGTPPRNRRRARSLLRQRARREDDPFDVAVEEGSPHSFVHQVRVIRCRPGAP